MDIKTAQEILKGKVVEAQNEIDVFTLALSVLQDKFAPELTTIATLQAENTQALADLALKEQIINEKDAIIIASNTK